MFINYHTRTTTLWLLDVTSYIYRYLTKGNQVIRSLGQRAMVAIYGHLAIYGHHR